METLLGWMVGIGLSAACGFRVFIPMLGISIAATTGYLSLPSGFEWLGTWPALIAFTVATALEIATYYIPVVDHVMDMLATPAAIAAGTVVMAAFAGDLPPFLKWTLAVIAGGGTAGLVQIPKISFRAAGQAAAPGFSTMVITTAENVLSILTTILVFIAPVLCFLLVILLLFVLVRGFGRLRGNRPHIK